jgi:hypothetical protein
MAYWRCGIPWFCPMLMPTMIRLRAWDKLNHLNEETRKIIVDQMASKFYLIHSAKEE